MRFTVATYNIHKGFSHFNQRMVVHHLRDRLRNIDADIIFLQEVVGVQRAARQHEHWPAKPQHEFLADTDWQTLPTARTRSTGTAITAMRFFRDTRSAQENNDISTNLIESRGLLHAEMAVPGWSENLHCVCVHLGLFARARRRQVEAVCERIESVVPHAAPLVLAGDFNDWRDKASDPLAALGVHEVFETLHGRLARTFPARLPILRLDRIYVRGFEVKSTKIHRGRGWAHLSDHAALAANLVLK